jgi:hypothetical protein
MDSKNSDGQVHVDNSEIRKITRGGYKDMYCFGLHLNALLFVVPSHGRHVTGNSVHGHLAHKGLMLNPPGLVWSGPSYYAGKENIAAGPESHSAGGGVSTPSMITASVSSDSEDCNSRG